MKSSQAWSSRTSCSGHNPCGMERHERTAVWGISSHSSSVSSQAGHLHPQGPRLLIPKVSKLKRLLSSNLLVSVEACCYIKHRRDKQRTKQNQMALLGLKKAEGAWNARRFSLHASLEIPREHNRKTAKLTTKAMSSLISSNFSFPTFYGCVGGEKLNFALIKHKIQQQTFIDYSANGIISSLSHSVCYIIVFIPFVYFHNERIIVSAYNTYNLITVTPISMLSLQPIHGELHFPSH